MENERVAEAQRQQAAQKQNAQANQIKEHVMGHYGMNDNDAMDFMETMSNPKSLNIDNLVNYIGYRKGALLISKPLQLSLVLHFSKYRMLSKYHHQWE